MGSAKMTLIGMYNYDSTLFNDMFFPAGIEKDLVISSLLMQSGEFEVLYPDPVFLKNAMKVWSSKWYRTFAEWYKGTLAEWNPIYNYDRYEVAQDDGNKKYESKTTADYTEKRTANLSVDNESGFKDTRTPDLTDKRTADLTDKRTANLQDEKTIDTNETRTADLTDKNTFANNDTTVQIDNSETEHQVAAYDSSSYQESSKDIIDNGTSELKHSGTVTTDHTGTDSMAHTGTDTDKHTGTDIMDHTGTDTMKYTGTETMDHSGTDTTRTTGTDTMDHTGTLSDVGGNEQNRNLHTAHMYGNIGVTTSAAMLKEFYDIAKWNLYEHICDVFTSELLIPVY